MRFKLFLPAFLALLATALPAASLRITVTDTRSTPAADAVVSLLPLDAPAPPATAEATAEITQQNEEFTPYVLPVRTGTRVKFPNRDTVQHHVYSVAVPKRFDIPLHGGDTTGQVIFDQPGVVAIGCNIHDWMLAYVVVVDTPWFALTATDGLAIFTDLPPGRYSLEIWHPRARTPSREEITLTATPAPAEPRTIALQLRPDRRLRRTPAPAEATY